MSSCHDNIWIDDNGYNHNITINNDYNDNDYNGWDWMMMVIIMVGDGG